MATYVTFEQAKRHLRKNDVDEDEDLDLKIQQAEAIILDYLKVTPPSSAQTDAIIQAAILLQLTELYRFRGDEDAPKREKGYLTPAIESLLCRLRDPALA